MREEQAATAILQGLDKAATRRRSPTTK